MISRRELLRVVGIGGLGGLGYFGFRPLPAKAQAKAGQPMAILFDSSLCMECQACRVACQSQNGTGPEKTFLKLRSVERGTYPQVQELTVRASCLHCGNAPCVKVCPTKAAFKGPQGLTHVKVSDCVECGRCVKACPFGASVLAKDYPKAGEERVFRCGGCEALVSAGKAPACVDTCIAGALQYGPREALLKAARERATVLKASHPRAQVYDPPGVGGLNVLLVLREEPGAYGLPEKPKSARV